MADQLSSDLASLRLPRSQNPERGRAWWYWLVVLVVLGGLGAAGYLYGYPLVEAKLFKTEVSYTEVLLISPAQGATELTTTGYVTPQTISHVGAKVPGRVSRVAVKEGDAVQPGQLLLQLEDADQRALIAASQSRVAAARARAQSARANQAEIQTQLARNERLAASGAGVRATVEDLQGRLHALDEAAKAADADARVAAAEAETASVNLRYLTVKAPIGGTVITKPPEVGDMVSSAAGILDVADFSSLMVEADVPEPRLHLVKKDGPCEISLDAFPGKRYRGAVAELGRRVNRAKATVAVKVRFVDAAEGVLPDMAGRVSFLNKALDLDAVKEPAKIVVPQNAIAERGGTKVVFVADPSGQVRMTPIELGAPVAGGFEVKRGPTPGTKLVKDPAATLTDGQSVKEKNG